MVPKESADGDHTALKALPPPPQPQPPPTSTTTTPAPAHTPTPPTPPPPPPPPTTTTTTATTPDDEAGTAAGSKSTPQFVHTTRLAAWRATRFKSFGAMQQQQMGDGAAQQQQQQLQGLSYGQFLERVAVTRTEGDVEEAEHRRGGYSRVGGMPLVFPYVRKPLRRPVGQSTLHQPLKREERRRSPQPPVHQEPRARKRIRTKTETRPVRIMVDGVPNQGSSPMDIASKTTISSVCSWCSIQARPPQPQLWIDPAVLKVPRSRYSLWRRPCEVACQTDPVEEDIPVPTDDQADQEWQFLADESLNGQTPDLSGYVHVDEYVLGFQFVLNCM
ncbi:hypothetical protein ACOMHN_056667 [Nucella lapillus]